MTSCQLSNGIVPCISCPKCGSEVFRWSIWLESNVSDAELLECVVIRCNQCGLIMRIYEMPESLVVPDIHPESCRPSAPICLLEAWRQNENSERRTP
jgi:predicted nucleic-acid-binding Zn-ribbon protein